MRGWPRIWPFARSARSPTCADPMAPPSNSSATRPGYALRRSGAGQRPRNPPKQPVSNPSGVRITTVAARCRGLVAAARSNPSRNPSEPLDHRLVGGDERAPPAETAVSRGFGARSQPSNATRRRRRRRTEALAVRARAATWETPRPERRDARASSRCRPGRGPYDHPRATARAPRGRPREMPRAPRAPRHAPRSARGPRRPAG